MVVGAVILTILFGVVAARAFGLSRPFGILTAGAVAICGASAALAISSVLPKGENHERDTVFTVIGVTALSTIAMIVYPVIIAFFHLDHAAVGVFLGGTIHDVAQVVGAGFSVSEETGNVATFTKLLAGGDAAAGGGDAVLSCSAPTMSARPAANCLAFSSSLPLWCVLNSTGIIPPAVLAVSRASRAGAWSRRSRRSA